MNKVTDVIKRTRIKLLELIEELNAEQLELTNINDVLCYLPYHDGLHTDRIAAYKRLIR